MAIDNTTKTQVFSYCIGSMVLLSMVTWIPSIYPSHVSMDPMGCSSVGLELENCRFMGFHGDYWNILEL